MKRQKEIWRSIEGYEGFYEVSNFGNVRSLDFKQVWASHGTLQLPIVHKRKGGCMKITDNGKGYKIVGLSINGRKNHYVHRLVASAFLPNKEGKPQVNHKDGNKANNKLENLEWVTISENHIHARKTGLNKPLVGYGVVDISTGKRYVSIADCSRATGINRGTLKVGLRQKGGAFRTFIKLSKDYEF